MNNLFSKLMMFIFALICLGVVGGASVMCYPKYCQVQGLKDERDQLDRRIADKNREIAAVQDKCRRFKTDKEFVEALARANRRVYPGELVFVFDEK